MLNHITIMGNMVANPELRTTTTGIKVCSFRIACTRDIAAKGAEKSTDFFDVTTWRSTAEFVSKYFSKGKPILIDGSLRMRDWEDKDGNKRRSCEIVADSVYFCGGERTKTESTFTDIDDSDGELPWGDDVEDLPL